MKTTLGTQCTKSGFAFNGVVRDINLKKSLSFFLSKPYTQSVENIGGLLL